MICSPEQQTAVESTDCSSTAAGSMSMAIFGCSRPARCRRRGFFSNDSSYRMRRAAVNQTRRVYALTREHEREVACRIGNGWKVFDRRQYGRRIGVSSQQNEQVFVGGAGSSLLRFLVKLPLRFQTPPHHYTVVVTSAPRSMICRLSIRIWRRAPADAIRVASSALIVTPPNVAFAASHAHQRRRSMIDHRQIALEISATNSTPRTAGGSRRLDQ